MTDYRATEQIMVKMADAVREIIRDEVGPGYGLMLVVFPYGGAGLANYISNVGRSDMIEVMRTTADRLERGETFPPAAGEA